MRVNIFEGIMNNEISIALSEYFSLTTAYRIRVRNIILWTESGVKRNRVVLSVNDKLDIAKQLHSAVAPSVSNGNGSLTIADTKCQKCELVEFSGSQTNAKKSKLRKTTKSGECENKEKAWFSQNHAKGSPTTDYIIMEKGRNFHTKSHGDDIMFTTSGCTPYVDIYLD